MTHFRMRIGTFCMACLVIISVSASPLLAEDISPQLSSYLEKGDIGGAGEFVQNKVTKDGSDHQARFALGVVKFLAALEQLSQDQYRYGSLGGDVRSVPVIRFPVPVNPQPEPVTYEQIRKIFVDLQLHLIEAEQELSQVDVHTDIHLSLNLPAIRFDLNGDGKSEQTESLATILGAINRQRPGSPAPDLNVRFDAGDVPWLRGYCHFLCAFCDMVLAYDHQKMFDLAGQWIYPKHVPSVVAAGEPLDRTDKEPDRQILDAIAAIHLASFPLKEPERMASARQHLLAMIRTSRESWALIQAETDNEREWVPNPQQTGVLQMPVSQSQIDSWHGVLTEMEDLLEGRKLIPFWRDYTRFFGPSKPIPAEGRGVNLKRFFDEPREFDLILFFQGHGALPFVEEGALSHPGTWDNLLRAFEGRFFGFAVWFN